MEISYIKRTCNCCKQTLIINNDNIGDVIYYDKVFYHSRCFIEKCTRISNSKRKNISPKWGIALNDLNKVRSNSDKYIRSSIAKEEIFDFIRESYGIVNIPPYIFEKLNNIYNGTFKGMGCGIPPEHLLDMWKKKIRMLNQIAAQNNIRGKKMDANARINYDLSILIGKYNSYLKWLEKQKVMEVEREIKSNENIVKKTIGYSTNKNMKEDCDDISGLVDDIFG